jgi:hypothetical protein
VGRGKEERGERKREGERRILLNALKPKRTKLNANDLGHLIHQRHVESAQILRTTRGVRVRVEERCEGESARERREGGG